MRTLLAMAAVLGLVACGDSHPRTLGSYVAEFAAAAEEQALRCGKSNADVVGERIVDRLCKEGRCSAEPACAPAIDECIDELEVMACDDMDYPSACFDLFPGFSCLHGWS